MTIMNRLNFGDIVLLKFPFTDGKTLKKRPALIINDFDDGDIIVCRITSQIYKTRNDIYIDDWEKSGLKLPSVIRVHKMATLEKDMVEILMGQIDNHIKEMVRTAITKLTDF
jgi:mRNA interferase MazF